MSKSISIVVIVVVILTLIGLLFAENRQVETFGINRSGLATPKTAVTPSPKSKIAEKVSANNGQVTPECSPTPTPQSEKGRNNPVRERSSREILDGIGNTIDFDCDKVCNRADNCIFVYNPDQKDSNRDGIGDACDPKQVDATFIDSRCDEDGDGISDFKDNCPAVCNPDQEFIDVNTNGVNDLCDSSRPNFVLVKSCLKRRKVYKESETVKGVIKNRN